MLTKRDLKNRLEEISPGAKFTRFDYVSSEKFRIELKCRVETDQNMEYYIEYAKNWIRKFSKFTATTWIVRNSFLKLKRLIFRKIYACHRSAFNKKRKMDIETRNQECKAKVDFKLKKINKNTIRNDKLLKEGLNLNISIEFLHSHKVQAPESYQLLRNDSETEETFERYFDTGCSASAAKSYHELTLIDRFGDNCPEVFENANMNPSIRTLLYLQEKIRKKKALPLMSTRGFMEEKREQLKESGFEIILPETDTQSIIIITPLMKRVILEIGLETVIIEDNDVSNIFTVSFFLVPTNVGVLPVACLLHDKNQPLFAFQLAKTYLETITGFVFYPKTIMMNNLEEKWLDCLKTSCLLELKTFVSRSHLCNEIWSQLHEDEYKIERKKRHRIMVLIKSLLYTDNLSAAEKVYKELQENESVSSNPKLSEYVSNLWKTNDQWMLPKGHKLNDYLVEMSIRFLREFITRRCKSFNEVLTVDVVTNILENNFKRILASYVKKGKTVATCTKFLTKENVVLSFGSDVRRISANEFKIDSKRSITFRTDTMCCDCIHGRKGHFCEHLSAIVNTIDCDIMKSPILTEEENDLYTKITGGEIEEEIRPEHTGNSKDFNDDEDTDNKSDDIIEDIDMTNEQSVASSSKSEAYNVDDFLLDVKTERQDRFDPLEHVLEQADNQTNFVLARNISNETLTLNSATKKTYETVLKAVNDEFRRLNRFFSENPNASNLETMTRLARELSKIRPAEKVNLDNMFLKLNKNTKRKHD